MCVLAGRGCSKLGGAIDLDSRACYGGRGAINVDVRSSRPVVFQAGWGDRFGLPCMRWRAWGDKSGCVF